MGTIAVLAVLILGLGKIVKGMVDDKKNGKSSCGCNCSSCPMSGKCHSKN